MVAGNPILGVGPSNYVRKYSQYDHTRPRQAHNSFVQCAGEFGLSGLFVYLALIYFTFRDLHRIQNRSGVDDEVAALTRTILASMVGYMVCGFFLSMEDFELR